MKKKGSDNERCDCFCIWWPRGIPATEILKPETNS